MKTLLKPVINPIMHFMNDPPPKGTLVSYNLNLFENIPEATHTWYKNHKYPHITKLGKVKLTEPTLTRNKPYSVTSFFI